MIYATLILAAATAVSAVPLELSPRAAAIPLKHISNVSNFKNIVNKGASKLQLINAQTDLGSDDATASSGSVTNEDVTYVAAVNVGDKVQSLIVDTGSSNTWCGAHTPCEKTNTGKSTGNLVSVTYGSGSFTGLEYTDKVSFGALTVNSQSIGSALLATGFTGVDGIIGFGPVDLTANTVVGQSSVPTFMDNLYSQKSIPSEVLGVYFAPEVGSDNNDANGELTLGGTDPSKYKGSIQYFPKLASGSAAPYWGIAISSFRYGSQALGASGSGIVDTGTTLIYIPQDAYNAFLSATGGTTDTTSGLASFPTAPTQNFTITFGSSPYVLTPAQYLVPQAQYTNFGLTAGKYYAWINNGGSSGVDCIVGQKFLENYYSVYDSTASRIGFAPRA